MALRPNSAPARHRRRYTSANVRSRATLSARRDRPRARSASRSSPSSSGTPSKRWCCPGASAAASASRASSSGRCGIRGGPPPCASRRTRGRTPCSRSSGRSRFSRCSSSGRRALIFGFALLYLSLGHRLIVDGHTANFGTALYMSGTTFVTLGIGDVTPTSGAARAVTVIEAGTGFGFLALVIGYLPVLYQSFSRRELNISLLDARAGSPPSAGEMLRRYAESRDVGELERLLLDFERWSADLLESHLSYPVIAYYRSQHDHQSWLGALTAVLDFSALILACERDRPTLPARRASVRDVASCRRRPRPDLRTRAARPRSGAPLARGGRTHQPAARGVRPTDARRCPIATSSSLAFRAMYEPYVAALSAFFVIQLPPWIAGAAPARRLADERPRSRCCPSAASASGRRRAGSRAGASAHRSGSPRARSRRPARTTAC